MIEVRERRPDAPFALGETPRAWGDFLADAATLAAALGGGPAGRETMVACADRYHVAVALLAIWRTGGVAALPPNGRVETIDRLCAQRGISRVLHDGGGAGGLDVRGVLAGGRPAPAVPAPRAFPADQPLASVYTSGSTGAHVACPKTAGQLLGEAALLVDLFGLGPGTRLLATVPGLHLYGLLFGIAVAFVGGGAFARATPLHAETIAAEAAAHQANALISVPAHLLGVGRLPAGALRPLRRIFSSGAPLDPGTAVAVHAATGTPVTEVLGSSETGGIAWRESPGLGGWRPFPGIDVRADAEGRMLVRSPFVAAAPPASTEGWYQGADRIAPRAGGGFDLLGRGDGVVTVGGTRVAVAETERLLRGIPGVTDAAVVPVDVAGPRRHELWAAVAGTGLSEAELRAALLRRLEAVAVPRRFRLVAALPREDNGKLVRARLLALFAPRQREIPIDVPRDWLFFRGHFDGFPILPGVVQLNELVLRNARDTWSDLGPLRRLSGLKFRKPIAPGDQIALGLARRAERQVTFELRRGSEVVSSGAMEFALAAAT